MREIGENIVRHKGSYKWKLTVNYDKGHDFGLHAALTRLYVRSQVVTRPYESSISSIYYNSIRLESACAELINTLIMVVCRHRASVKCCHVNEVMMLKRADVRTAFRSVRKVVFDASFGTKKMNIVQSIIDVIHHTHDQVIPV